jgi:hypothetical protein
MLLPDNQILFVLTFLIPLLIVIHKLIENSLNYHNKLSVYYTTSMFLYIKQTYKNCKFYPYVLCGI